MHALASVNAKAKAKAESNTKAKTKTEHINFTTTCGLDRIAFACPAESKHAIVAATATAIETTAGSAGVGAGRAQVDRLF